MSQTFSITCPETKTKVWIGQGFGQMTTFYSREPETMARLGDFLRKHEGKALVLLCDDTHEMLCDYREHGKPDEATTGISGSGTPSS